MIVGGAIVLWAIVSVLALALCRVAALGDFSDPETEEAAAPASEPAPGLLQIPAPTLPSA